MVTTLEFNTGQNSVRRMFPIEMKLVSFQEESMHLTINGEPIPKNKFMETMNLIVDAARPVKIKVLAGEINSYPITIEMLSANGTQNYTIDVVDGVMIYGQDSPGNIAIDKGYFVLEPGVGEHDCIFKALWNIFSQAIPDPCKRHFIVSIVDNQIVLHQKKKFKAIPTEDGSCKIILVN